MLEGFENNHVRNFKFSSDPKNDRQKLIRIGLELNSMI